MGRVQEGRVPEPFQGELTWFYHRTEGGEPRWGPRTVRKPLQLGQKEKSEITKF